LASCFQGIPAFAGMTLVFLEVPINKHVLLINQKLTFAIFVYFHLFVVDLPAKHNESIDFTPSKFIYQLNP
jgi:hypothetical protein